MTVVRKTHTYLWCSGCHMCSEYLAEVGAEGAREFRREHATCREGDWVRA